MKADSWRLVTLGDLIDIKHGFAFKGKFFRDSPPGDILLTPGNFAIGGGFKSDKFKYYAGDVPEGFVLKEGELLVTMTDLSKAADTLGYPALVPKASANSRFLHNQRLGKILISSNRTIRKDFLYYLLQTKPYRHEVIASATGTTVKHTSPERIKAFRFLLPSEKEQKAIARILGTLDDKIELNQQMNRTLEATARAIFKSWFVDFDPVRAKIDGRQPEGMDALTAALFPAAFEDSELGMIPKGWEVIKLDREIQITKGRSYKSSELTPSATALVTLKSFQRGGGYRPDGLKPYTGKYKPQQIIKPGELVVAYTDLTQAADVIGKPAIVRPDNEYEILVASLDLGIVRPKTKRLNIPFLYYLFSQEDFQNHVYAHVNGSTVLHLNKVGIPSYEFCCPPSQLIDKFYEVVNPIFSKTDAQEQESISLANLRDTLLPKLMSGEIRVTEAEKMVENVT